YELLRTRKIDIDFLIRYSNAPWLVIDDPGAANHGMFARNRNGIELVWDNKKNKALAHTNKGIVPNLTREIFLSNGQRAKPVLRLMADRYGDEAYAPEAVAEQTGISADAIRDLAAEIAKVAFEEEILIKQPWTDMKGERHEHFVGRPVSMHAMRGISAHSNGFQTCRALHILQVLIGSVDCPGGFRSKPPYPKPDKAHPKPHARRPTGDPTAPLNGPHLGYPQGPEDLLIEKDGQPLRIDKAFSWDAPLAAHGMMHMVIANAHAGDPYKIDTLFMYMANMAWNSSMNSKGVIDMLVEKDTETGEYVIPHIIYSDAYSSETVAYADLILPDTTYLERHDCISLLDRPISEPDSVNDAIRWPVVEPDRDVRGFQSVLIDLGSRLKLNGFVDEEGKALYKDYADYIVNHQRRPDIGPLAGFRGEDESEEGRGTPNPNQLERYKSNGSFWSKPIPLEAQFFKHANAAYQNLAVSLGFFDSPQPVTFQLYSEVLQKFRLAAQGHGKQQPPDRLRKRIETSFDPLPIWYLPLEAADLGKRAVDEFPYHAITQRPMAMYHSWGSQNAWLRQIHGENPMYIPAEICDEAGIDDGDWAWIISYHGRIKVPVMRMNAVNPKTLWTWNAIGKRKGAWALDDNAPETRHGFLLNHLIHELLPPKGDGLRWSNSDPITGQAAWFDLRVRVEKAEVGKDTSEPQFKPQKSPVAPAPKTVTYGKEWTE
ncbi:MAG: molybdopterin oxidoreductase family protein, partial [Rhizobiaceae bacterium]